ncbi:MAG: efflux transporter outer rane subunit [Sediminibacterium sp.]|nr:efflux transporter outer rane subunit [Sediminibacterium sp.]
MNQYLKIYITAIVLAVMSACTVSKDLTKMGVVLPDQFRNASQSDTSSIADIPWKDFFADVYLQKLIDSALLRNYDMQIAVQNTEAAQLLLSQTRYAYLPDVKLQAGAALNRPSDNSLNGISLTQFLGRSYVEDYSAAVNISWEADIWGKIKNQKVASMAGYLQSAEARKAIQTNLVAAIAKGYYNLLLLDAQLATAQKNVLLSDSTLRIARFQFDAGQVTELAVQQTAAQRLVAAQLVPLFEQEIILQENALSLLTGSLPAGTERHSDLRSIPVSTGYATGLPAALVSHRPDVQQSQLALDIANARSGIARANMYPALSISALGGVNAFKASNWFSIPASLFGTVVGGIAAPLFQKKELQTQYALSKVDREKTVIRFRQSVLTAVGEVSDALANIEKLKEQQAIATLRRATLEKAIGNAQLLFKNGMASYLEVLTAQSSLLQSELETESLQKAQLTAHVDLYRALGGGWK